MKQSPRWIACALLLCTWAYNANAEAEQSATAEQPKNEPKPEREHFRIGAIGGVSFPRPLAIEGMMKIEETLALGVEYSVLPTMTIDVVQTSYWAVAGDARIFFMRGPFYIGIKGGLQHLGANASMNVAGVNFTEAVQCDTIFLNPRLGVLWTWKPGFTVGFEAGVQLPIAAQTTSTMLMPAEVTNVANTLGRSVLPTVDLLRVGFLL